MPKLAAVIMAAGKGTRMKSKLPKVMHPLAGKPLIEHVLEAVNKIGIVKPMVILGHGRETIRESIGDKVDVIIQEEQLGTGHAVRQAIPYLEDVEDVFVLSGDQPLLRPETLQILLNLHQMQGSAATVLTACLEEPYGLGRIVKNNECLAKIVEEKDASPEERLIREINTGTYCFKVSELREALAKLTAQNAQGEYYLTEVFDIFLKQGKKVLTYCTADANEALGINSRSQLAEAEGIIQKRICEYWMEEGVTIADPSSTFIDSAVKLAPDVTILPFTFLKGETTIEEDAIIGPQTTLESCYCGAGSEISHTVAYEAIIGERCKVGPYTFLRPGTKLAAKVKVGDFVEIKNSQIGEGAKIPHLSYIGDAQIGKSVNIGAGTITCNYDGANKYPTKIGDNSFVGSNTNLVAPVEVGEGATIGAGSTITKDVPAYALAVERCQQVVKEHWQRKKKK